RAALGAVADADEGPQKPLTRRAVVICSKVRRRAAIPAAPLFTLNGAQLPMPSTEETFMRAPPAQPRKTIYTEAMEIFHRAAELMGLDSRVRLELEEPDY